MRNSVEEDEIMGIWTYPHGSKFNRLVSYGRELILPTKSQRIRIFYESTENKIENGIFSKYHEKSRTNCNISKYDAAFDQRASCDYKRSKWP